MRAMGVVWVAAVAATAGCGTSDSLQGSEVASDTALVTQSSQAAMVAMTSALSTPAQRHVVRVQPANHAPVHLMAVQNDGYSYQPYGLLWYRSDDGGATWRYYKPIVSQPDPAVFNSSRRPTTLHLTADLIVVGNDIAAVYSYDSVDGSFPADSWDPQRVVYFQWWRFDGANDWVAGRRVTVASPGSGQAYRRAELARDGAGRLWIQSFLRRSGCSSVGSSSCVGDLLQVWVSVNEGASFQGPQILASLPNQLGGGRLISVGSQLLMLWGDYSIAPAKLMRRNDGDPLTQWSAAGNAFSDGAHIYHGASLSAAADGTGGLHLVYKRWIADPDAYQLYYRRFDGSSFGSARSLGVSADWATQPAITSTGSDLQICVNHLISTNTNYEMRSYRLSRGFSSWDVLDNQVNAKAYPAAPERVPSGTSSVCAFGMGNSTSDIWGAGHTVQVALQAAGSNPTEAAAPTLSPPAGTYASAQSVTLSTTTSGATIYYTTDGTTPTSSSTRYAGAITVAATTTVKAIATASGYANSAVASGTYTIQTQTASAATPTFSPPPGPYASSQSVTLSTTTAGATIYYTTDGTTPTSSSTRYAGAITVGVTTTIKAMATASGYANSAVASGTYTIGTVSTSLFSDDFGRTTGLGTNWSTWYGSYSTNGSAAVSGAPPIQGNWASVSVPLGTSDYAVGASMAIPSGALYSGIVARSSGADFTSDLYSAQLSADGGVNLYRRNGWNWTLLAGVPAAIQAGRLYTLQLVTTGTSPVHLEVWLDGSRVITVDDSSSSRLTSGGVGLENYDAAVQYDSFRVDPR